MWNTVFGRARRYRSRVEGCFSEVYYGRIQYANFMPCTNKHWWYNQQLSTWWIAFGSNLRHDLQMNSSLLDYQHDKILNVFHPRGPDWLWEVDWESHVAAHERTVVSVNFTHTSLAEQVRVVLGSKGIISHAGAGFTHQVYMQPRSIVLQVYYEHHNDFGNDRHIYGCQSCKCIPRTCHDMLAFHLGHDVLTWKWCGWCSFKSHDASNRLAFLLSNSERAKKSNAVWACHMLTRPLPNATHLQCDVESVVPWPPGAGSGSNDGVPGGHCGSLGFVGVPLVSESTQGTQSHIRCILESEQLSARCPRLSDETGSWKPLVGVYARRKHSSSWCDV